MSSFIPPPPENDGPPVPVDKIVMPPDPSVWKKYSSHFEFPLSMLASVVLHLFLGMMVLLFGALLSHWGSDAEPPEVDNIVFAGGGGSGEGGTDANPQETEETVSFTTQEDQQLPAFNVEKELVPQTARNSATDRDIRDADRNKLAGDIGKGGTGTGGGKGSGHGTGEGSGIGPGKESGIRVQRSKRWTITIPYDEPDAFVEKLATLQAVLFVQMGTRFVVFDDLSKKPFKTEELDDVGIQKLGQKMQRIWYSANDREACRSLAEGLGLKRVPDAMFIFVPRDLENEMFKKEKEYRGMTEDQLNAKKMHTWFDVNRTSGGGWLVRVTKQEPLKGGAR